MAVSIVVVPILILIAALCVAIPVTVGIYVYRDANRRKMNAALWTLISVLAPGFIGLIIYLIIRSNYSAQQCPQCGANVSENFSVCPSCGYSLKNKCPNCAMPLEPYWNICPNCANPIPSEMRPEKPVKQKKDKGMRVILILVIVIPLLLCILLVGGIAIYRNAANNIFISTMGTYVDKQTDDIVCEDFSVADWYKECDEQGEGIYILRARVQENESKRKTTKMLVYRNDGYYSSLIASKNGGIFSLPTEQIMFEGDGVGYFDALADDYSIAYFEFEKDSDYQLEVLTNGEESDYTLTDVSDLVMNFDDSGSLIELEIPTGAVNVYSMEVTLFYNGDEISSGGVSDLGEMSDGERTLSFEILHNLCRTADEITVSVTDEDGNVLAESEKYPLWDEEGNICDYYRFRLISSHGKMEIVYSSDVPEDESVPRRGGGASVS